MKVTPINRKFGKHLPGDVFEFPDKAARLFIKVGKLKEAPTLAYNTRMMQAAPVAPVVAVVESEVLAVTESAEAAPYGYKADGTPRARPGRPAKTD